MANTLTNLIPVLYQGLDLVSRELVGFIPAVSLDAKADSAAVGQTITTSITPAATIADVVPGQLPPDDGDQALATLSMSITKSKYSPIRWSGEELKGFLNAGSPESRQAAQDALAKQFAQSMRAITNAVELDLAVVGAAGASRAYGTAATTPFATAGDMSDLAQTRKILEDNGCPMTDCQFVMNTAAGANLRGKQSNLFKVNEAGTDSILRKGAFFDLEGFQVGMSGQLKQTTAGAGAVGTVTATAALGATSISITTAAASSLTVLAGDVLVLAGDTNKYVVAAAATIGASTTGTVTIQAPGLLKAASAAATTVGATFTPNVAFCRDAMKLLARSPAMPDGGDDADDVTYITDPTSGLTFQVAVYRLYRRVKYEVGLAWGVKNIKPEWTALLLG